MLDPHVATIAFAVFGLLVGVVVFGGTTLAYFLEGRRTERSRRPSVHIVPHPVDGGSDERDRAHHRAA